MDDYPLTPEQRSHDDGAGPISVALGGFALFFAIIPFVGLVAWPLSIAGLVVGTGALRRANQRRASATSAMIGLGLSTLALLVCVGWVVATAVSLTS